MFYIHLLTTYLLSSLLTRENFLVGTSLFPSTEIISPSHDVLPPLFDVLPPLLYSELRTYSWVVVIGSPTTKEESFSSVGKPKMGFPGPTSFLLARPSGEVQDMLLRTTSENGTTPSLLPGTSSSFTLDQGRDGYLYPTGPVLEQKRTWGKVVLS